MYFFWEYPLSIDLPCLLQLVILNIFQTIDSPCELFPHQLDGESDRDRDSNSQWEQ